jgi:hypothetical protein
MFYLLCPSAVKKKKKPCGKEERVYIFFKEGEQEAARHSGAYL